MNNDKQKHALIELMKSDEKDGLYEMTGQPQLDLKALEEKLDSALANETPESLNEWLEGKRSISIKDSLAQILFDKIKSYIDPDCGEMDMSWLHDGTLEKIKGMEIDQKIECYYQGACDESENHGAQYVCRKEAEEYFGVEQETQQYPKIDYSPYCPICQACGVDGCCAASACQQHPDGSYCGAYLKDLKLGYIMSRFFDEKIAHKVSEEVRNEYYAEWNEAYDKIFDETNESEE